MTAAVSVAIPVLDGGALLDEVLGAVRRQRGVGAIELVVADSGSTDGSPATAHRHGATVVDVPRGTFSHGGTRNLLMRRTTGDVVAFLTQDAVPADETWLAALVAGFDAAPDVGLVSGPYRPRPDASIPVARELVEFFAALSPSGATVIDRAGEPGWDDVAARATFFTDANGAVARRAWERVPFPEVRYAEDRLLARAMLAAGFAKAFAPAAAVVHSHDYPPVALLRRYFDEFRGLRETFGHVEPADPRRTLGRIRREVAADRAWAASRGADGRALRAATLQALRHHVTRAAGAHLGSRADRLPPAMRRRLSLEGRATFEPVSSDATNPTHG